MEEKIANIALLIEVQNRLVEDEKLDDHLGAIIGNRTQPLPQERSFLNPLFSVRHAVSSL